MLKKWKRYCNPRVISLGSDILWSSAGKDWFEQHQQYSEGVPDTLSREGLMMTECPYSNKTREILENPQSASRPFPAFFRRFVQQQGADASQGPRAHPLLHVIWRPATTSNKTLRQISEEKNTQSKTVLNWILVKFMNNIHNFFLKFNCCKSEKGNLFSKVLLYFHGRVRWPQTPLQSHFGAENLISM